MFKELGIVKEKRDADLKACWYANDEALATQLELTDDQMAELKQLAAVRMQPLLEEAQAEEAKRNEEQRIKEEIKEQKRLAELA